MSSLGQNETFQRLMQMQGAPVSQPQQPVDTSRSNRNFDPVSAADSDDSDRGYINRGLRAFSQGALGAVGGAVEGVGLIGRRVGVGGAPVQRAGRAITEFGESIGPAESERGVFTDIIGGAGSMATYVGPGLIASAATRGLGAVARATAQIGAASTMAGPAGAAEAYNRAIAQGVPEEEALELSMQGIPAGVVQVAPVAVLLRRIPPEARGRAVSQIRHLAEAFGAEFIAEGSGAVWQNLIEQSYNPERGTWDDSLYQAAIGGSASALLQLGIMAATRGRGPYAGPRADGDTAPDVPEAPPGALPPHSPDDIAPAEQATQEQAPPTTEEAPLTPPRREEQAAPVDDPDADLPPRVREPAPAQQREEQLDFGFRAPPTGRAITDTPEDRIDPATLQEEAPAPASAPTQPGITEEQARDVAQEVVDAEQARQAAQPPDMGQVPQPAAAPTPPVTTVPAVEPPVSVREAMEQGQGSVTLEDGRTALLTTTPAGRRRETRAQRLQRGETADRSRAGAASELPTLQALSGETGQSAKALGPFRRRAQRAVERDGENAPSYYRDVIGPDGKPIRSTRENRDIYQRAREEEFEAAQEFWEDFAYTIAEGRDVPVGDVINELEKASGKDYERLRAEYNRITGLQQAARDTVTEFAPEEQGAGEVRSILKGDFQPTLDRFERMLAAAEERGLEVPKNTAGLRSGATPEMRHLAAINAVMPALRRTVSGDPGPKISRAQLREVLAQNILAAGGFARDASDTSSIGAQSRGTAHLAGEDDSASVAEQEDTSLTADQQLEAAEEQREAERYISQQVATRAAAAKTTVGVKKDGTFTKVTRKERQKYDAGVKPTEPVKLKPRPESAAVTPKEIQPTSQEPTSRERTQEARNFLQDEGQSQFKNHAAVQDTAPEGEAVTPEVRQPSAVDRFTAAFRRWFGNSQVVDAAGNPLVVYHGTSALGEGGDAFNYFIPTANQESLFGKGIYFTESAQIAGSYGQKGMPSIHRRQTTTEERRPNVYPVYLSIQNALDMDAVADRSAWSQAFPEVTFSDAQTGPNRTRTNEEHYRAVLRHYRETSEGGHFQTEAARLEAYEKLLSGMKRMGHDGITHTGGRRNITDEGEHRVWIAFEPTQIKSAISNRGTYDPVNADIRARLDDTSDAVIEATPAQIRTAKVMRANPKSWTSARESSVGAWMLKLHSHIKSLPPGFRDLYQALAPKLRSTVGSVNVYFASPQNIQRSVMDDPNLVGKNIGGYYDPETNVIILSDQFMGMENRDALADVLMHEALHAALQRTITNDAGIAERLTNILEAARTAAVQRGETHYGLTDVHELVSEAFSNPAFIEFLSSVDAVATPAGPPRRNLFQAFLDWVTTALGFDVDTTLLGQVIRATNDAFGVRSQYVNAPAGERSAFIGERARGARSRMNSVVKRFDRTLQNMGYKVATTYKIAQDAVKNVGGRFGDAVHGIVTAYQKMGQRRTQLQDDGHRIMQKYMDWQSDNPRAAAEMGELLMEATPMNVVLIDNWDGSDAQLFEANKHLGKDKADGWQAKARLKELQQRYDKLTQTPGARDQWAAMQRYFRDTQNRMTRNNAEAMIDGLVGDALNREQRDEFVGKVIKGTLGQADAETLTQILGKKDGPLVFQALQDARALRAQVGVYFPGMRHGDFVVRTKEALPDDLMGGQLQEGTDNVIEFRAYDSDTNKANREARAKARAFAEKTELTTGTIKRVFIDRQTGETVAAADLSSAFDVDVVYRVPVQREGLYSFDSRAQGQEFIDAPENQGRFSEVDSEPLNRAQLQPGDELSSAALRSILTTIEKRPGATPEVKAAAKEAAQQASLKMMPGNRIRQRAIMRRNVAGASRDLARSFHAYVDGTANYISRQEFMPQMRELEAAAREEAKKIDHLSAARSMILNELSRRINTSSNDARDPNPWVSRILRMSFLNYLASPAYSMVNATQPAMVTYPTLAGEFGGVRSSAAIIEAYNTIGGLGVFKRGLTNTYASARQWGRAQIVTDDPFSFMMQNVAKAKDGKLLAEVIEFAAERGLISRNAGFELGRAATSGGPMWENAMARTERIARQLPFATEVVNRSVPLIATYRLAKSRGMSHQQAMQKAFDVTMDTQGDYSATNAPPLFKHDVGRIVFQFKKYPQLVSQLLVSMFRNAFGPNATAEERRIAYRQLTHLAGVQIAVAGAFSIPGLELVKVPMMLAAAAGWGEGWEPYERELQQLAKETFGKPLGEMMSKGVLTRGLGQIHPSLGVDLSRRVSLAHLWTFGEPREMTDESIQAYLFGYMVGAPGSMLVSMGSAMRDASEGDYVKALGKFIPAKVFSDFAKAMGDDELDIVQRAMLTAGLQPAERSNRFDEWRGRALERQRKVAERRRLERQWRDASPRERVALRREVEAYNRTVGFRERTYPWNWSQ